MIKIAVPLIGNGLSPEAVFAELRGKFPDRDVTDAEIIGVVKWACGKNPQPSGHGTRYHNSPAPRPAPVTVASATAAAERFLKGFRCDEADLFDASPWRPLEDPAFDALPLLAGMFHGEDLVNFCPEHGVGMTKTRDQWLAHVRDQGAPSGRIGCLFRFNPVNGRPSGENGGYTDADIIAHRFALIESDILPLELQLSVIAKLPLPIAAIIFSGGKSYHCIIKVDAPDAVAYRKDTGRMLALLRPLGFDQATGNPSRMTRLPGAIRSEEMQKLIYLNPDAAGEASIFGAKK